MRSGKLMTQSKPEDLIRAHNAMVCYCIRCGGDFLAMSSYCIVTRGSVYQIGLQARTRCS